MPHHSGLLAHRAVRLLSIMSLLSPSELALLALAALLFHATASQHWRRLLLGVMSAAFFLSM
jgi:hypothetical protein